MHSPATDEDVYEWPTCTACQCQLWVDEVERQACRPCQDRTQGRLQELPGLFARLNTTAALVRGSKRGNSAATGSKAPPIPPNLQALDLVAAGGVATRLRDIEDSWRATLGWGIAPWRGNPGQAVPQHVTFLLNNLPWACDAYSSVGQDIEEIRRLHGDCTSALSGEQKPGRVKVGVCPTLFDDGGRCGTQLTAGTANPRIRCSFCGTAWADDTEWRQLRAAQVAVLAADAGVAA